jgi:hypothetical protein
MKKHFAAVLLALLAMIGASHTASAESTFSILDIKNPAVYYNSENIDLRFSVQTPHDPLKVTYYVVNEKTKKKRTKLGGFNLESMSVGFGAGIVIDQKKGKYHYEVVVENGTQREEYKTQTIEVLPKKRAGKPHIKDLHIEFGPSANYTYYGPGDYRLALTSGLENDISALFGDATLKCSQPITFYSKMGNIECSKKKTKISVGSKMSEVFGIYSQDLENDITLEVEYKLLDTNLHTLDKEKAKYVLSAN